MKRNVKRRAAYHDLDAGLLHRSFVISGLTHSHQRRHLRLLQLLQQYTDHSQHTHHGTITNTHNGTISHTHTHTHTHIHQHTHTERLNIARVSTFADVCNVMT